MSDHPKPRHRLFIDEIESVGAVPAGDNEEAEIVFWKATQSERASAILEELLDRERRVRAAKRGIPIEHITRARVLDDLVRDKASAAGAAYQALLSSKDEGDVRLLKQLNAEKETEKAYRAELAKFRAEKARLQKETPMSDDDTTLHDEVIAKVRLWARRRNYDLFGRVRGTTVEKVMAEFWGTPEGAQVAALLRDPMTRQPAAEARGEIRKSGEHVEALRYVEGLDR